MIRKTFKYRIFPTNKQKRKLDFFLKECCWLYNYFLDYHKDFYIKNNRTITRFELQKLIPELKKQRQSLNDVCGQVLQDTTTRIRDAFGLFFKRIKNKKDHGYPRYKTEEKYRSITYAQYKNSWRFTKDNKKISLVKIGKIKIKLHRKIEGIPKTISIKKTLTGKWYATILCEIEQNINKKEYKKCIGVDVGIHNFATLSDGNIIKNPEFNCKVKNKLKKAYKKNKINVIRKIHEKISNKRHNFIHQQSKYISENYDLVVIEDLNVNSIIGKKHICSKKILDCGWGYFLRQLSYKVENTGGKLIKVNPAYTSKYCSKCGHRNDQIKLRNRIFICECCGEKIDRDLNSAKNILALGIHGLDLKS